MKGQAIQREQGFAASIKAHIRAQAGRKAR
jgi:hypothetical protein